MSFPKESNKFPVGGGRHPVSEGTVATEIAKALRRELGNSHAAVKTVAQWTGASERAAKNWLAGRFAPSGEHLVSLVERSNEVLFVFLILAHRHDVATAAVLVDVRDRLRAASLAVDRILGNDREEG
ncbi:hypothetical protein [Methylobacterium aquaticum]|uniref:hypothetical protein n=1 Tax=Methylobacterium aquaticum TaxID=270351 RepID=UPI0019321966|nr:hypothetical protein [Methylobacterium aquaticum]